MELGQKLREERVRQGWNSGAFASASHLNVVRLLEIEENTYCPSTFELDRILHVLRKPLAWVDDNALPHTIAGSANGSSQSTERPTLQVVR